MLNYVKNLLSSLVGTPATSDDDLLESEKQIINAINSMQLRTGSVYDEEEESEDDQRTPLGACAPVKIPLKMFECVHKTGKVTHLSEEYGLIDNVIHFVPNQVSSDITLKQDDEVLYTAYKAKKNESERVYKIYGLKNDLWEHDAKAKVADKSKENNETLKAIIRHIPGRVTKRKDRQVFIDTINTWCNLDKVQTSFIPVEGDWLSLEAAVAVEPDVPNFVGDILYINSIKPLIKKSSSGRVTLWSSFKQEGAIENSVFFSALECENGYIPSLGDQVVYDAIESDQESFKWRALIVYPYQKKMSEKQTENDIPPNVMETSESDHDSGISIKPVTCAIEVELNQSKIICFEMTNNCPVNRIFKNITFASVPVHQLEVYNKPRVNFVLKPNNTVKVYLSCKGTFLGISGEVCFFRFDGLSITRKIEINVLPSKEMDSLLKCQFENHVNVLLNRPMSKKELQPADLVLHGSRPWKPPKFISTERRCIFTIPQKLEEILNQNLKGTKKNKILEQYAPYLKYDLDYKHYSDWFHSFLYIEELELRLNFRRFDMDGVILFRSGKYLSLKVPGLVERRPSVIIGDTIVLTQPWALGPKIEHVGFIHDILEQEVLIKFHESFHDSYDETECNVKFIPNTFFFSRCHEAVKRAKKVLGEEWLFPSSVNEKPPQVDFDTIDYIENIFNVNKVDSADETMGESVGSVELSLKRNKKKKTLKFFNNKLNQRQRLAVLNVLKGQGRPLPYIIFGPPGTGKTITLVEIILQIYFLIPESRILVTTPSNSAADLICTRLIEMVKFSPGELIRLAAFTRVLEGLIPTNLIPYTSYYKGPEGQRNQYKDNENLRKCSINELTGKHKITVSTCTNVGRLHYSGFPNGHFTHILVDEAGQSVEPEVLISATFQNKQSGQVVLVGDPLQLGPTICSSFAKSHGFGVSLIERFIKTFPYAKDIKSFPHTSGFDPRFITRLNINYRSVPEILALPSQMFYNWDLIPTVSPTEGEEADIIKKFNFTEGGSDKPAAIIFHGIVGKNFQEYNSPSWFNPHEIWQVVVFLKKLYAIGLKCTDIGILTPYSKQVEKLADVIYSLELAIPKIGSVEEFQGQERKVIIMSAVRSSMNYVKTDITHHLGFIACPKRLNVSLTRARALLIIIGNPVLLSQDPYWVSVIKYCIENKSYTGCNLKYFSCNLESSLKKDEEEEEEEEENDGEEGECEKP